MAKKKRKKTGLKGDRTRQAHDSLRGYLYQIWHSVNAWLELKEDEILYLEVAEDFHKESDNNATVAQVKATQHNITLRSEEVNDAINHYWQLRMNNSDWNVKFRFLTHSKIGVEQGNPFGTGNPGLQVWSRCSRDEANVKKISNFLQTAGKISEELKDFLKQAEPQEIYEQLIEPIFWETGSKPASFVEKSISDKLIYHGDRHGISPSDAKKVVDHLLKEALTVATRKEIRELTRARFLEIFEEQTTQRVPNQYLRRLQTLEIRAEILDTAGANLPDGSSEISTQSHSSILNKIPPIFPDAIPRADLLKDIQTKLQSEGMVVIHGGAGRGKTTLAKLTAKAINGSWLWLNFTRREPPQVIHLLQQLSIAFSNQSEQINVVLDDLNVQPQQLQEYEQMLEVVVYGVLERGAKLLITSQHKPPKNFTLRLGVSPSIVVHVPDFNLSEIEQFTAQLGCPTEHTKTSAQLIELQTSGHPRLVHARLVQLREENWIQQNVIKSLVQTPGEVVEEREEARRLLTDLPPNQQEFLYRLSLMVTEFRKDYAVNIGEIPDAISHSGDVFDRLVGPWIDSVDEKYFMISPLLTRAADQVWSESIRNKLHAQIADAILKTRNLTRIEAWAVLTHSIAGKNKLGFIAVINALRTVPEENWKEISQEFSWLIFIEPDIAETRFPGDVFVRHIFRSLQYRIATEVEPGCAPKRLETWDKETTPHEPLQSYLLNRLTLATEALKYHQVLLPAKQMIGYLKEIIDITDDNEAVQEIYYGDLMGQLEEHEIDTANYFSFLFSFVVARRPVYASFLSDLIDALDELPSKTRTLLLADFEDDTIDSRLLIDGVWWGEANLENPGWNGCLQVFEKVIEKAIAWGYPHLAAASARAKLSFTMNTCITLMPPMKLFRMLYQKWEHYQ